MSFPIPPFDKPVTAKELAYYLPSRSTRWIRRQCKAGKIKTLPVGIPYVISANEANRILGIENDRNLRETA